MTLIYPSINNTFAWVVKIAETWTGLMLILVVVVVGRKWLSGSQLERSAERWWWLVVTTPCLSND